MTTSTRSANAAGLPSAFPAIARSMPRRGFLAGLAALPLLGGSVALIGRPTAVAEPTSADLMKAYRLWLSREHRAAAWEMADWPADWPFLGEPSLDRAERYRLLTSYEDYSSPAARFHTFDDADPQPSTRAALVLSAVGCNWRGRVVEQEG